MTFSKLIKLSIATGVLLFIPRRSSDNQDSLHRSQNDINKHPNKLNKPRG